MNRVLLIVAAGKSSRFGGFPKAFASVGDKTNVENTIQKAWRYYDQIFLGVSKESYPICKNRVENCEVFEIETGNGEGHSLLRCLEYIRMQAPDIVNLSVCWGDAHFLDDQPFAEFINSQRDLPDNIPALVACAVDQKPYAWFEAEGNLIQKAHFKSLDGEINEGIHDQSLFFFRLDLAIEYLRQYKALLEIPEQFVPDREKEMKLLYSFDFLYKSDYFSPAQYALISRGKVLSYNTKEELDSIVKIAESSKKKIKC